MRFRDLSLEPKFGRLKAIKRVENRCGRVTFLCKCDCGGETSVNSNNLTSGAVQSCGCLGREIGIGVSKHGGSYSPTYVSWSSMLKRCTNPNFDSYPRYGGRGITVCDRWRDYANFLADMGERPEGHSLDRYPNNTGNYEPGNVRWATPREQQRNRSDNVLITHGGLTLGLHEWSERTKIDARTIYGRLKADWPVAEALTTPVNGYHPRRHRSNQPST